MALSLCATFAAPNIAFAVAISGQGTWESTLQGRDLDGNLATFEAYYDTVLDITWLADANYAKTSGYDADGYMTWSTANAWAAGLDVFGITGWRLPTTTDTGTPGCNYANTGTDCGYNVNSATSEMAHLSFITLGNRSNVATSGQYLPGDAFTNTGPFSNITYYTYWSATEYAPNTANAWEFSFNSGWQFFQIKTLNQHAWAVHAGDVGASAVPVPAAAWLFGSGLLGLVGIARRKAA